MVVLLCRPTLGLNTRLADFKSYFRQSLDAGTQLWIGEMISLNNFIL